jgi:hypothetical protein
MAQRPTVLVDLIEEGLKSYQRLPIHHAREGSTPGVIYRDRILADFYGDAEKEQGGAHSGRAALSRAIKRLAARGLLEPIGRNKLRRFWRLTGAGARLARALYPECSGPSRAEMLKQIKQAYLDRKARRDPRLKGLSFSDFRAAMFKPRSAARPAVKVPGFDL